MRIVQRGLLVVAALACAAAPVQAKAPGNYFKGKTLTLVISSAPGGGYDTIGRLVMRFLKTHLDARAVIVRNMPGAGGIVATNYLYSIAPKNGTTIGLVQNNTPFEPLYGTKQAQYDARKFNWLGSPSTETGLLAVWHKVPVDTVQQVMKKQITVASTGEHSTPSFYARLLNATLGTKLKIVVGYPGQAAMFLAMERGEVDGNSSIFYSSLLATHARWLREHKIKLLVQYGLHKLKALPNVPFAPDLAKNGADKLLMEAGFAGIAIGRPFLAPPGAPKARVAELRQALAATFKDPAFVKEADKIHLLVNDPRTGPQLARSIERAYQSPPSVIARLRKVAARGQSGGK